MFEDETQLPLTQTASSFHVNLYFDLNVAPRPLGPLVTTYRDYRLTPQTNTTLSSAF